MTKPEDKEHAPTKKELPLTIVFVRHAQAGGEKVNDELGPLLTKLGEQQAALVAERLSTEHFTHAYTSDFSRAFDTAKAILKFHPATPYTVNVDVREVHHFHFVKNAPKQKDEMKKVVEHEWKAVQNFAAHVRKTHSMGEVVLVVTHGNFIRSVLPVLGNRNPKESILLDFGNSSVSVLDVWPSGEAVLRLGNCMKHLPSKMIT
ncbi:MAG: hypothetical protein C0404_06590 [Verrucomicrobia bacterium]|nr:hypothetical protein [Verrucomicrobiota bacterium]